PNSAANIDTAIAHGLGSQGDDVALLDNRGVLVIGVLVAQHGLVMALSRCLGVDGVGRVVAVDYRGTVAYADRAAGVGAVDLVAALQAGQRGLNGGVCAAKVEVVEVEAVWLAAILIL